ncbi:MAG TPA: 1,2-phenylacetyl-CoA epoxidase subunit PaaD [Ardenticatenaceae bacterium]|nr:1,2-phenylacetyl-CoA epoxidase subunit PaaD [Ardenticatenaceae bacterium]
MITAEQVWQTLEEVKDPEIPVISVVEMGIIQGVEVGREGVAVTMTPTFAGCPAIELMCQSIREQLSSLGVGPVSVNVSLDPPWTSDRISPAGREKLKTIGLAPPMRHGGIIELDLLEVVRCPYCDSADTNMENPFGPTLCRALYYCNTCQQPFEKFKAL